MGGSGTPPHAPAGEMKFDRLPGWAAPVLMVGRLVPVKELGTASDSREGSSMLPAAAGSCRAANMLGTARDGRSVLFSSSHRVQGRQRAELSTAACQVNHSIKAVEPAAQA